MGEIDGENVIRMRSEGGLIQKMAMEVGGRTQNGWCQEILGP